MPEFFSAWFLFQVFDGELPMIILTKDKENCSTYWTRLQFLPLTVQAFSCFLLLTTLYFKIYVQITKLSPGKAEGGQTKLSQNGPKIIFL